MKQLITTVTLLVGLTTVLAQRSFDELQQVPLVGHDGMVLVAAYNPSKAQIATATGNSIMVWDAITGQAAYSLEGHDFGMFALTYSPDGKYLATASPLTEEIKLWDLTTKQEILNIPAEDEVIALVYSPDGSKLFSIGSSIRVWDIKTGLQLTTLGGNDSDIISLSYSPDGNTLVSVSFKGTFTIWDAQTTTVLETFMTEHDDTIMSVDYHPDGSRVITGSLDSTIRIWDINTGAKLQQFAQEESIVHVAYSPDGSLIAALLRNGRTKILEASTGQELFSHQTQGTDVSMSALSYSPDGRYLVVGGGDWVGDEFVSIAYYWTAPDRSVIFCDSNSCNP